MFPRLEPKLWLTSPRGPYSDYKTHLGNTHQETKKDEISYSQLLEGTRPSWGSHGEVTGRETERNHGLVVLPLLKSEGRSVPRVLWIHSLLVGLKYKNAN